MRIALSVLTFLALGCDPNAPGVMRDDASLAGDDAGPDAGGRVIDGVTVIPLDGGAVDAGMDAGEDAGVCECPAMECQLATCVGETCDYYAAPNGTPCLSEPTRFCIDGACSYGVCGDRYREPGADPEREGCDDGNLDEGDACSSECAPSVLVISSRDGERELPAVVSVAADDTGDLLFVWSATVGEQLELRAHRYDAAGVELGPELVLDPTLGLGWDPHAAVVGLATGWAVVWAAPDGDADEAGIRYAIVPATGTPATSRRANQHELGRQAAPAVTRTTTGFLVAWADESGTMTLPGESRLRMRSFDPTGRALADEAALSPEGTSAREVAFASDDDRVLAVWTEDPAVPFARPSVVGLRLGADATPFTISEDDGAEPSAAFLASGDFAVAFVSRAVDPRGNVHARLVHSTGDPLMGTADTELTSTPMDEANVAETAPRVLPLDAGYLVTYEDGGASMATPPRAPSIQSVLVGASPLAPEFPILAAFLEDGLQADVTLLRTARGSWFAWSDAGALGEPRAHRSFVAYLLPPL